MSTEGYDLSGAEVQKSWTESAFDMGTSYAESWIKEQDIYDDYLTWNNRYKKCQAAKDIWNSNASWFDTLLGLYSVYSQEYSPRTKGKATSHDFSGKKDKKFKSRKVNRAAKYIDKYNKILGTKGPKVTFSDRLEYKNKEVTGLQNKNNGEIYLALGFNDRKLSSPELVENYLHELEHATGSVSEYVKEHVPALEAPKDLTKEGAIEWYVSAFAWIQAENGDSYGDLVWNVGMQQQESYKADNNKNYMFDKDTFAKAIAAM